MRRWWTAGMAGIHSVAIWLMNVGRFAQASPSRVAAPYCSKGTPAPVRNAVVDAVHRVVGQVLQAVEDAEVLLTAGLAMLALRTGAPIVPVGFAGYDRVWPRGPRLRPISCGL